MSDDPLANARAKLGWGQDHLNALHRDVLEFLKTMGGQKALLSSWTPEPHPIYLPQRDKRRS